jgi:NAD(P)-dependent dehydrogenase (short-subunit alcohol dehydrogenase family)
MSADKGLLRKFVKQMVGDKVDSLKRAYRPRGSASDKPKAALVFGVGAVSGIGAAVAILVAQKGMRVYVAGRNAEKIEQTVAEIEKLGGIAIALILDVSRADEIASAFARVAADGYIADLVVDNIGTNRPRGFLDLTVEMMEKSWRNDCLSGFLIAQHALNAMLENVATSSDRGLSADGRGRGTLIFTGASASLRGKAGFASFAQAKAGLRLMAQSLAREFGPQGIHVVHIIIDGMVDGERLRTAMPGLLDQRGVDTTLRPDAIAQTYWDMYQQHPSTWTHEIDLRPSHESW